MLWRPALWPGLTIPQRTFQVGQPRMRCNSPHPDRPMPKSAPAQPSPAQDQASPPDPRIRPLAKASAGSTTAIRSTSQTTPRRPFNWTEFRTHKRAHDTQNRVLREYSHSAQDATWQRAHLGSQSKSQSRDAKPPTNRHRLMRRRKKNASILADSPPDR